MLYIYIYIYIYIYQSEGVPRTGISFLCACGLEGGPRHRSCWCVAVGVTSAHPHLKVLQTGCLPCGAIWMRGERYTHSAV